MNIAEARHGGGPAVPTATDADIGMSLLDWFAGQALVGLMTRSYGLGFVITHAYDIAEAMLVERLKAYTTPGHQPDSKIVDIRKFAVDIVILAKIDGADLDKLLDTIVTAWDSVWDKEELS